MMDVFLESKLVKEQKTNYLTHIPEDIKMEIGSDWTQPTLTENGTMGGSNFACDQSDFFTEADGTEEKAWHLFSDAVSQWQVNNVDVEKEYWASWYNPIPLKITSLQVKNGGGRFSVAQLKLQGSNDNLIWEDLGLTVNNNTTEAGVWKANIYNQGWFKYYRILVKPRERVAFMIQRLFIEAQEMKLTLKAESKVHLAYGNLDDIYTTKTDISNTQTNSGKYQVILSSENNIYFANLENCLSGNIADRPTSISTNTGLFYAIDEKKIYLTGNSGADWYNGTHYSLPLAEVTIQNGFLTIDKIFNGFSYIGYSRFLLKGLQGIAPDGLNADKTLNNYEWTLKSTNVYSWTPNSGKSTLNTTYGVGSNNYGPYYEQEEKPTTSGIWFNPKENIMYLSTDGGVTWKAIKQTLVLIYSVENKKVTSFNPRQAEELKDVEVKELKTSDTVVYKAKNILETQENSLNYAPELGIDLKRFLDPDVKIQNKTFEAYSIQKLGEQGVNPIELIVNKETFRQVFDYTVAEADKEGMIAK